MPDTGAAKQNRYTYNSSHCSHTGSILGERKLDQQVTPLCGLSGGDKSKKNNKIGKEHRKCHNGEEQMAQTKGGFPMRRRPVIRDLKWS